MKLLCLDLSTSCTGFAVFDAKQKLIRYGKIKAKVKGISALKYPKGAYKRIINISDQIKDLVAQEDPDLILIEEINKGISRISQKSLDALHFFVIDRINLLGEELIDIIKYMDTIDWRGILNIKLDEQDKAYNKGAREHNKKPKNKNNKLRIIDAKDLAIRHVNKRLKLDFEYEDNDVVDAICLGLAYFDKRGK